MHGDGARVHGKVQEGTGAERDNGARGRWKVHRDSARVFAEGQGGDRAERDNGALGRCTGARGGARRGPGDGVWVKGTGTGQAITVHGDDARVHGKVQAGGPGQSAITVQGRCTGGRGPGQSAITVHGDGARVHGKVQEGTGAERDNGARGRWKVHRDSARVFAEGQGGDRAERHNGARGRCTGARGGARRGPGDGVWVKGAGTGQAITVHGDDARVHGKVQAGGPGQSAITVQGRCTGGRGPGQSAITVHGDGARVHGKVKEGDRGRARQRHTGTVHGALGQCTVVRGGAGRGPGRAR